jgi:hypothetical protein
MIVQMTAPQVKSHLFSLNPALSNDQADTLTNTCLLSVSSATGTEPVCKIDPLYILFFLMNHEDMLLKNPGLHS